MLTKEKQLQVQALVKEATKEELAWINGYLMGLIGDSLTAVEENATPLATGAKKITIAYGTETGNSKKLATELASKAKKKMIIAKLVSLDQYRFADLQKETNFLTIISTQGEGEPPPAAKKFYDHIHQNGFKLDKLNFGVLALGDTSYPLFCKAGEDVDQQLEKLGGKRILPIQKCDVEYDEDADKWFDEVLDQLFSSKQTTVAPAIAIPVKYNAGSKPAGKTIYEGTVLSHINLNDRGSNKETWHLEIAAENLTYEAGDSIGILPKNDPETVNAILALVSLSASDHTAYKNEQISFLDLLTNKLNIANLSEKVIQRYATVVDATIAETKLDLLGLLQRYPTKGIEQFEAALQVLIAQSPRLYTVSSSPVSQESEVHITVARDIFYVEQEKKYGRCSDFLSKLQTNESISFFVQKNKRFKLPETDKDIIMIGPGTGIAAFRSFLLERDALGATGKNWLFFGEQHFESDFLYQTEIQNWHATGVLTKVQVAFSRDQQEKIYVQHKMLEHGAELFEWLDAGAYVYICGKKDPMSTDVENCLLEIIELHGNKTSEEAKTYFENIKAAHRYHKDVY